jgi:hypothetical protein
MSKFNLLDTNKIDDTSKLQYNYYDTTIGSSDVEINKNGGNENYAVNISYPVNTPNILYPDNLGTYNASKIYLSGVLHDNIQQLPITNTVGELIIEHSALTGSGKLYVCMLLNSINDDKYLDKNYDKSSIDNLIEIITSDNKRDQIILNTSILVQQNAIVYKDADKIIIVFVTPLIVSGESKTLLKKLSPNSSLFGIYNDGYKILPQNNISMTGKDEIYIDCSPTGASAEEIATYNVPINSEYTKDSGKIDVLKTTIQLCLAFFIIMITYYTIPYLYKIFIVKIINKLIDPEQKTIRNTAVDVVMCILAFMIFIALITGGKPNQFDNILYGVYFFVFFGLSLSIIIQNKTTNYFDTEKWNKIKDEYGNIIDKKSNQTITKIIMELGKLIIDVVYFIFTGPNKDYRNIISIVVLYSLTAIILIICRYGTKAISQTEFSNAMAIMFVLITVGVSMTNLFNKENSDTSNVIDDDIFNPIHDDEND